MRRPAADAAVSSRPRASRAQQRQRLIDACISALHVHGPSNTTVEKVVAIARMSPGIVRFYFDSKAAMLVASLEYLAAEFEELLLVPVSALRSTPVEALQQLVDLYLGPEIASARKVSVWYSFWGEASSRQEYYDICGQRDVRFEALVRELIGRLIEDTSSFGLDADGIALGLIGVLEMLWQGYAFQTESTIDRAAARRRCMAYLRSVFPTAFAAAREAGVGDELPPGAYASAAQFEAERVALFAGSWQYVGLERQLAERGDYLTLDIPGARALILRGETGLRAFQNACRHRPHALFTARSGNAADGVACARHGLAWQLDGEPLHGGRDGALAPLEIASAGGLLFVRAPGGARTATAPNPAIALAAAALQLHPEEPPTEVEVAADWKLLVEQWLETSTGSGAREAPNEWQTDGALGHGESWSGRRYQTLLARDAPVVSQRSFVTPNQLLDSRPGYLQLLQVLPFAAGRCRVRSFGYLVVSAEPRSRALAYVAARLAHQRIALDLALAASVQRGLETAAPAPAAAGTIPTQLVEFRHMIARLTSGARRHPGDSS